MAKTSVFFRVFPAVLGATLSIVALAEVAESTEDSAASAGSTKIESKIQQ
jgi:hypothetical protein